MNQELINKIESLGFKQQHSSWDRGDLSRMTMFMVYNPLFDNGIQFEKVITETDVWQLFLGEKSFEIVHAYKGNKRIMWSTTADGNTPPTIYIMEFERLFCGNLPTEEELMTILKLTNVPLN